MVEIECPVEGCDFSGPLNSVEGHISASNGNHKGEAGANFREELRNRAEEAVEELGVGEEDSGDSDEEAEEEGAEESRVEEDEAAERMVGAAGPLMAGGGALLSSADGGINKKMLVIGVVAILLLVSTTNGTGGSSGEGQPKETRSRGGENGVFE